MKIVEYLIPAKMPDFYKTDKKNVRGLPYSNVEKQQIDFALSKRETLLLNLDEISYVRITQIDNESFVFLHFHDNESVDVDFAFYESEIKPYLLSKK